jgi:hypothetical protein
LLEHDSPLWRHLVEWDEARYGPATWGIVGHKYICVTAFYESFDVGVAEDLFWKPIVAGGAKQLIYRSSATASDASEVTEHKASTTGDVDERSTKAHGTTLGLARYSGLGYLAEQVRVLFVITVNEPGVHSPSGL